MTATQRTPLLPDHAAKPSLSYPTNAAERFINMIQSEYFTSPEHEGTDGRNELWTRRSKTDGCMQWGISWPEAPHLGTYWLNSRSTRDDHRVAARN